MQTKRKRLVSKVKNVENVENVKSQFYGPGKKLGKGSSKTAVIAKLMKKKPKHYFSTNRTQNNFVIVNTKIYIDTSSNDAMRNFLNSNNLQTFLEELKIQKQYSDMTPPLAPTIFKISFFISNFTKQDLDFNDFIQAPFDYLNENNSFQFSNNSNKISFSLFEEKCDESIENTTIIYDNKFFNKLENLISTLVQKLESFFKDFKPQNTCPFYNNTKTELISLLALDLDTSFIENIGNIQASLNLYINNEELYRDEVEQICESFMLLQYLFLLSFSGNNFQNYAQNQNIRKYLISKGYNKEYLRILCSFFMFRINKNQNILRDFVDQNSIFHYFLYDKLHKFKAVLDSYETVNLILELFEKMYYFIYSDTLSKKDLYIYSTNDFTEKLKLFNSSPKNIDADPNMILPNENDSQTSPNSSNWLSQLNFGKV
jgi:hypothetical protein